VTEKQSLISNFAVISPQKKVTIEPVDASLYARLDENYNGFKGHELVSCHEFTTDWDSWEIHPNGDEIVVLLSGKVTFVFDLESQNEPVALTKQGDYAVVPRNVWHTAKVDEPCKVLFITPGENTQHKQA